MYKGIFSGVINDKRTSIYFCYPIFIDIVYSKVNISCSGICTDINICSNRPFGIYINIAIIKRKCTDFTIFSSIPQGTVCQIQIDSTIITSISIESPGYSRISSIHIQRNRSAISSLNIALDHNRIICSFIDIYLSAICVNSRYIGPFIIVSNCGNGASGIINYSRVQSIYPYCFCRTISSARLCGNIGNSYINIPTISTHPIGK